MERLYNNTKTPKKNVFSDPSHRMPQRPPAIRSGEGLGFQDLGPSLLQHKLPVTYGKAHKGKSKPAGTLDNSKRRPPSNVLEDNSDDELLLSSQNSMGGDATSSTKHVRGKKSSIPPDREETIRVNGQDLLAHPDYRPSSCKALKNLRFTKNKKAFRTVDPATEVPPPSSSTADSQDLFKPISDDIEILDDPPAIRPSSSQWKPSDASSTRQPGPAATRVTASRFPDTKDPSTSKPSPLPAKPLPNPYVVTSRPRNSSPQSTLRPAVQKCGLPLCDKSPKLPPATNGKRIVKKPPPSSSSRREPQEFPMSLQAKENVSDGARSGDTSSARVKKGVVARAATFVHAPKPIPLPSPLRTRRISRGTTFPNLSPLSPSKAKGKARIISSDEDDVDLMHGPGKRSGPKPFPMSSQMLADINRRARSPSSRSHKFAKRASFDNSNAEQAHSAKKRKDSRSGVPDMIDYLHEPMEDDSIELGYARDPSKLCPYCDEELPSHPTPLLQHLLAIARRKSVSDPRPRNRGGLKAPLTIYISVCQRHRFESHQLPIAVEKGWPRTIDFTKVPARVNRMKAQLEAIVLDKGDVSEIEDLDRDDGSRGPKSKSVFWREVKKEVKRQGSRAVVGVKGQFASFEKTQPGYYGEQGSVIIHQTLFDLFPPSTFDASLIAPLAPAEFIQRILVPEAAVRLIAQDLGLGIDDAVVALRESAQYGIGMFPDTNEHKRRGAGGVGGDDEDEEMGVADKIVMERARARRKELAEEERVEREMLDEERAAQRAKAQENRRGKALKRARQAKRSRAREEERVGAESTSEVSEASVARGTRQATRQRAIADDSETDAMSVDSRTSKRSARTAKKGTRGEGKAVRVTPDSLDSSSVEFVSDSGRKGGKGRGGARERGINLDLRVGTVTAASRKCKKPLEGFAWLDSAEEQEDTPRPARQWGTTETKTVLPLQVARNRPSGSAARDDRFFRFHPEPDSDTSNASRRLDRPPIKKGRSRNEAYVLSSPNSSDCSE